MTDWMKGEPQLATEEDCHAYWSGGKDGKYFKCYLCGHKFIPDDYWRFVLGKGTINFLVCKDCDCENVADKFKKHQEEALTKYWAFTNRS